MMTIYFYGSNREIVAENVKKCYSMIEINLPPNARANSRWMI